MRSAFLLLIFVAGTIHAQDYDALCAVCHGADASGSDRGPTLKKSRRLRGRSEDDIAAVIRNGTPGGMPPFALPPAQLQALAKYVRTLNVTAFELKPAGDVAAGERIFFGEGKCGSCHMSHGRGKPVGPDLSGIARQLTLDELRQSVEQPNARIADGYGLVNVVLRDGRKLRGFARSQGNHDLQFQTTDGRLHSFLDTEYKSVTPEKGSLMPPAQAPADLIAYLASLGGVRTGPLKTESDPVSAEAMDRILHPRPGEWPTYYGNVDGNRYTKLDQIGPSNVKRLRLAWSATVPHFGLETTPLVIDGVMYVTGPNQVNALDPRTGRQIWTFSRPRSTSNQIAGDARRGAHRGVALMGDRVFFVTDEAHLLALHRTTGALLWDVVMPDEPQHYGATLAPLAVDGLVIAGVAGADQGIRGFVDAYKATTGERAWRFWTVPKPGEKGSETWKGDAIRFGGGSTWLTGTYDPETGVLYWPTGNPYPDTDGADRKGDNLYTNCVLALELKTGKLIWHFQFTPHDLHDWDATEPPVLVDAKFRGRDRKLLLQANRNGFFYVLDRTNGEFLMAAPFVKKVTWASGIGADGRPVLTANNEVGFQETKTCPNVRGATNWYSPAYSPQTGLFYFMAVEDCGVYWRSRFGGFAWLNDPADPGTKYLRALDIQTGKIVWEIPQVGPVEANYSGVLATATGLVFYGETGGNFAAVDARTGQTLWHHNVNYMFKASPITYLAGGKQYVAIATGPNILAYSLSE